MDMTESRDARIDFLHGVARYIAEILNAHMSECGSLKRIYDEISIHFSGEDVKFPYYDSAEIQCDDFRYFIVSQEGGYYRFTIVRKPVVEILSDTDFYGADFQQHNNFKDEVISSYETAVNNLRDNNGIPTDDFAPLS